MCRRNGGGITCNKNSDETSAIDNWQVKIQKLWWHEHRDANFFFFCRSVSFSGSDDLVLGEFLIFLSPFLNGADLQNWAWRGESALQAIQTASQSPAALAWLTYYQLCWYSLTGSPNSSAWSSCGMYSVAYLTDCLNMFVPCLAFLVPLQLWGPRQPRLGRA